MEKKDIAIRQIKASARLYIKGDYVCSITLSGAAEEILGEISKKRNGINQFDDELNYLENIFKYFSSISIQNKILVPNHKELIKRINGAKNELKHNDGGENKFVNYDFEFEAAMLFIKAVKNYYDCYNEFPNDKKVVKLFYHLTL